MTDIYTSTNAMANIEVYVNSIGVRAFRSYTMFMRYLGIDYGTVGVGLALSDEGAQFAFPLETLPNDAHLLENIAHVIEDKKIGEVVMGDTRAEGGASNTITERADRFRETLAARTKIPISAVREVWSSVEASRFAPKGHERDDAASAAIILQRYLDMHKGGANKKDE